MLSAGACTDEPGAEGASSADLKLGSSCELTGRADAPTVTLSHPEGWLAEECGRFDADGDVQAEDGADSAVDVTWSVVEGEFGDVATPASESPYGERPTVESRLPSAVAGREAVRVVVETANGTYPEGTELTYWFVDLSADGGGRTLVGSVADIEGVRYESGVDVLDAMAHAVELAGADDASGVTVGRIDAGTESWRVMHRDGCLRMHVGRDGGGDPTDEICDLGERGFTATYLLGEGAEADIHVVVGVAPSDADVVRVDETGGKAAATVPLPEGRTGFAFRMPEAPATLFAETFYGEALASTQAERSG